MGNAATGFGDRLFLGMRFRDYVRSLMTPGNVLAGGIVALGVAAIAYRFWMGLGAATNLTQATPWGLWIGFDMLCGVALAAGGFTLAAAVHLLGLKAYEPVVRPAILTGFLGYLFAVIGLMCDLGQPWRIPYPIFYQYGVTSVMFEVGWCVFLYLTVLALEFSPAFLEWMGFKALRKRVGQVMLALIVLGVLLSTLHQSSLGSLFLMAPGKMHPLWYSPYIPLFFFVSAIVAGISMVIVESGLSHRAFHHRLSPDRPADLDGLTLGLARGGAVVMFAYLFLRLLGLSEDGRWRELASPAGGWLAMELVGLTLVPCLMFAWASRHRRADVARIAAGLAVLGIVVNRVNVSVVAWRFGAPDHYVPSWIEITVSVALVTAGVLMFRWIVNRMPVLNVEEERS